MPSPDYATTSDKTKISRILTTPKKGYKLGTTSATWNKLKSATAVTTTTKESNKSDDSDSDSNTHADPSAAIPPAEDVKRDNITMINPNGDLVIVYPYAFILEVWSWSQQNSCKSKLDDTLYLKFQHKLLEDDEFDEHLYIESILLVVSSLSSDGTYILVVKEGNNRKLYVEVIADEYFQLYIPDQMNGSQLTIKLSEQFFIVSNIQGYMMVYKFEITADGRFTSSRANSDFKLDHLKSVSTQPFLAEDPKLDIEDGMVLMKTSCFDNKPIFDLVGSWLVYSPTTTEYNHMNNLKKNHNESRMFTPVKLPPPGPLLNRVLLTLSNTALDGLFRLSEMGSNKFQNYMNKNRQNSKKSNKLSLDKDFVISMNSVGKAIGKILYSTASNLNKKSTKNNELCKIVDLSNGNTICFFKPPGGISNLSLSPYDLQLVNSNLRGDNFYLWDLYKCPNQISLIGKFLRGKTSAIIKDIYWFINTTKNNLNGHMITSNNSGFGCITKKSGSIHWYNINYLSCGNLNNNLPNILGASSIDQSKLFNKSNFSDLWILSSFKSNKFITIPTLEEFKFNQLAVIDNKDQLRLISPLNGAYGYKFQLPKNPVNPIISKDFKFSCESPNTSQLENDKNNVIPLSQTEIETCAPYLNLINNPLIEFSTFDFKINDGDLNNFINIYENFGECIPTKVIDFDNKQKSQMSDKETNDLLNQFSEGFDIEDDHTTLNDNDTKDKANDIMTK